MARGSTVLAGLEGRGEAGSEELHDWLADVLAVEQTTAGPAASSCFAAAAAPPRLEQLSGEPTRSWPRASGACVR